MQLADVRGVVLDVDGTLVHRAGEQVHVQPGARELLDRIRASGRSLAVFTNGSHAPPEEFAAGLREAGLQVADDELLTPLVSVQVYLRAHRPGAGVLLFGTDSARAYLERAGVRILGSEDAPIEAVFVAQPAAIGFPELERAARAVLDGAPLLTGSYAPAYAGADGPIFSRGAMTTAAIAKASGAQPIVVGKPSLAALEAISDRLAVPPGELVVVGDDLTLDVALGRLGGARTVLVRTGISSDTELEALDESARPHAVVDGVADLLEWL